MEVKLDFDEDDGELLAAYVTVAKGKVHETIEIVPRVCMADVSRTGKLIGFEILSAQQFEASVKKVATRFKMPEISKVARTLRKTFAAA